jgi:hypothetical protein
MVTREENRRRWREILERSARFRHALGVPVKQATKAQVLAAARLAWPEVSFSDDCQAVDLPDDGLHIVFDNEGRVLEVLSGD